MLRDLIEYNKTIVVNGILEFEEEHSFFPFDNYNLPESRHLIEGGATSLYQVSVYFSISRLMDKSICLSLLYTPV